MLHGLATIGTELGAIAWAWIMQWSTTTALFSPSVGSKLQGIGDKMWAYRIQHTPSLREIYLFLRQFPKLVNTSSLTCGLILYTEAQCCFFLDKLQPAFIAVFTVSTCVTSLWSACKQLCTPVSTPVGLICEIQLAVWRGQSLLFEKLLSSISLY